MFQMKVRWYGVLAASLWLSSGSYAQEPVVAAKDPEALFHSSNPKLDANKQVAYHIVRDILESGQPEAVDKYLTERYIQHNPNFPSGREAIKKMVGMMKSKPAAAKLTVPVVSVTAEGDLVIVTSVAERSDAKTGKTYTTTHFDMWRIKDGKADEHWDEAPLGMMGPPPPPPPK